MLLCAEETIDGFTILPAGLRKHRLGAGRHRKERIPAQLIWSCFLSCLFLYTVDKPFKYSIAALEADTPEATQSPTPMPWYEQPARKTPLCPDKRFSILLTRSR
jgi:hypothetical protein